MLAAAGGGRRPEGRRIGALAAALAATAAWAWWVAGPHDVRGGEVAAPVRRAVRGSPEPRVEDRLLPVTAVEQLREGTRRTVQAGLPPPQPAPVPARDVAPSPDEGFVLVRGRVRRCGLPVGRLELDFVPASAALDDDEDEDDWDLSDEDGRFEVELAPGSYVVRNDGGAWLGDVTVPAGVAELAIDLQLPLGELRGRAAR
jgi:hypothetical protein